MGSKAYRVVETLEALRACLLPIAYSTKPSGSKTMTRQFEWDMKLRNVSSGAAAGAGDGYIALVFSPQYERTLIE